MTFRDELVARLRLNGPIPLSDYMALCNAHYYATRDPLGVRGDFITAPEISQIFGELIGLWAADLWLRSGAPTPFRLAELGPGRGTLMVDALRATRAVPGFHDALSVHFIETSPYLRALQQRAVPMAAWHADVAALQIDPHPLILIANEFFDALPVEVLVDNIPLQVELRADGQLGFIPPLPLDQPERIQEHSPASHMVLRQLLDDGGVLKHRLVQPEHGWERTLPCCLLIIDYGYTAPGCGTSLQAVARHACADPLQDPGSQDLTAHVDFAALAATATALGCSVYGPASQGSFLRCLGIDARTAALVRANPARGSELMTATERLSAPEQMGSLFKVMALATPGWAAPAGFAES